MKTVLLLRHAKSSWKDSRLADHDRPLNHRGKRDGPIMGRLLFEEGIVPELIISSSAQRALSTSEAVASACDYDGEIWVTRSLYHADPATYLEVMQSVPDEYDVVMIVGHNPGMEDLLHELAGGWERMQTAALAQVELETISWAQIGSATAGQLVNIWRPKELSGQ